MNIVVHRIDSDLGVWTHSEWRPSPGHPLASVVERIWDFEGRTTHRRERVFPNGNVELIVQLDDRYHDVHDGVEELTSPTCVTGVQAGPMVVQAPRRPCRVLGVRFHPPGAWAVLEHPLAELTGVTIDLRDIAGSAAEELADRCADAVDARDRLCRTIGWLGDRLNRSSMVSRTSPAVCWVADRIIAERGAVRIASLRDRTGLGAGRLAAAFLEQVGVTPKRFARVHRFRHALDMLNGRVSSLADIALRAGYYDQPHMNAEFRELAGLTPGEFLATRRYPASTSTAES